MTRSHATSISLFAATVALGGMLLFTGVVVAFGEDSFPDARLGLAGDGWRLRLWCMTFLIAVIGALTVMAPAHPRLFGVLLLVGAVIWVALDITTVPDRGLAPPPGMEATTPQIPDYSPMTWAFLSTPGVLVVASGRRLSDGMRLATSAICHGDRRQRTAVTALLAGATSVAVVGLFVGMS